MRKLLQQEQGIRLEDRHLSLDPGYIWVDCLEFDRVAHHPDMTDRIPLRRALNRYRSHFLEGESSFWVLAFRARLRAQYISMAERFGNLLEMDGDWSGAIDCYLRAIEVEPLAESFYRRLIGVGVDSFSGTLNILILRSPDVSPRTGQFQTTSGPLRWFALTSF